MSYPKLAPATLTLAAAIAVILMACSNSFVLPEEKIELSPKTVATAEVVAPDTASTTPVNEVLSFSGPTTASNIPLPTAGPRPTMHELRSRRESKSTEEQASTPVIENLVIGAFAVAFWSLVLSMVLGLLWSPFAALVCLLISDFRRLPGSGYGGAGFRYSLLFLLPWVYLVMRMAGVTVPSTVVRVGYGVLYGLWMAAAAGCVGAGLFTMGLYILGNEDARGADATLLVTGGSFIGVLWFLSLRRLLRRHRVDYGGEPSVPMRAAYIALYALWALFALGIFFEGMYEFSELGRNDSSIPLWTCAALMALIWVGALKAFDLSTADGWDRPLNPDPDQLPPDSAYLAPFVHLYLLVVIPGAVGIAVYLFGVILWLG